MNNYSFDKSPHWRWQWESLCGPGGLKIWSVQRHDIGLCFQQFCLHIPVLMILAACSSYYFGSQVGYVIRGKTQIFAIKLRCLIIAALTFLPLLQIYINLNKSVMPLSYIDFFLSAVQGITWLTHLCYCWSLRNRLGLSPRGPIIMCVTWSLIFVLTVMSFRTHYLIKEYTVKPDYVIYLSYGFSLCYLILQIMYALTLIPGEGETVFVQYNSNAQNDETQALLHNNAYYRFSEENDPTYLGIAMEGSNWLSGLLFYWVNTLMEKGVQGKLNSAEDLYDLPLPLSCNTVSNKLHKALNGDIIENKAHRQRLHEDAILPDITFAKTQHQTRSLFQALHKCFWVQFYSVGILKFTADCLGFAGPMLLNKLVSFIENKSEDVSLGYIYASALFLTTLIASFANVHFNFLMAMVGLKIRASVVTTIYRKTLTVSGTVLSSAFSVGEIVNFMSTDTDRIVNSCPSFHSLWSIPFQISITLYLLYTQVGLAFLAGVAFTIVLIPINKFIAKKIGELSTKMMAHKDSRVKILTEILRGIKTIKLHVWEQHFSRIVLKTREEELKYLKGRKYLDALCVYFWATTPVLISILTFGTYVLMGNELTAATVFTSMALLNMLIGPLNAFPWVLNGLTEAWVSVKRIQRLLDLPDLNPNNYYDEALMNTNLRSDLIIRNANFTWDKQMSAAERAKLHTKITKNQKTKSKGKRPLRLCDKDREFENIAEIDEDYQFSLNNISINIKKGTFIGIIGPVGSGKSSLLSGIIAELNKTDGKIAVAELERGFGYVNQQPWLQHGTVRDNILFGKTYDEAKYRTVLFVCGLNEDIATLPAGDLTGVGEGGITLSGGQKARVALARAVYQDKSIYLLDDITSAVDVNVGKHIIQHCILDYLKHKTRILCTHHVIHLIHADHIICLEEGRIIQQGKPKEVLPEVDDSIPVYLELGEDVQPYISCDPAKNSQIEEIAEADSILDEEHQETGTVQLHVYGSYWKAIGNLLGLSILLSVIIMQASRNMTDWWLSYWVTNTEANHTNSTNSSMGSTRVLLSVFDAEDKSLDYYMGVYATFAGLNSLFTLVREFLFAYGGILAASKFHRQLLKTIVKAKLNFFDTTPLGRILNRFSSDTYTIDDSLPFILNILLAQFFGLIGSILITIYGLPWLCLILVPLIPVYHWLQHHYRLTSRELKRLSSVTLSPIYNHFNESLQGLSTIRALRATQRFKRDNIENVEGNQKAQFAAVAAAQWLGLRLQFIGVAMITGVSFIAVIQHQYDVANPGLVGLAISYALSVTGLLNGVVNAFTETEREMIAVERVDQYIDEIKPETVHFIAEPPYAWPSQGVVIFNKVVLQYREHLPPSLKSVTFKTRPAEKIGVVGRTGAGKSSLLAALFRLTELSSGSIHIDSVDISHISLAALRSRLWCIPQDPFLFSGTVRANLDPLNEFRDSEIHSALNRVNMADKINKLGGLDYQINSGGSNLSVGQKQLLCLARAVLINAKILCIDEATANVDQETDRNIQLTIRSAFRKSTVITIAHRVDTVLDCDRILVMGDGQMIEFDTPDNLLSDPSSMFYQLVNKDYL